MSDLNDKLLKIENLVKTIHSNNERLFQFIEDEKESSQEMMDKYSQEENNYFYFQGMRDAYETILNINHVERKSDEQIH